MKTLKSHEISPQLSKVSICIEFHRIELLLLNFDHAFEISQIHDISLLRYYEVVKF